MSYELTYLQPNLGDWYSLQFNNEGENGADKAKQNKERLNQQLLSAMQMQNIMVLAGSGTSLGNVNGPSIDLPPVLGPVSMRFYSIGITTGMLD